MRYRLPENIPVTWSSSNTVRIGGAHLAREFPDHPAVHSMLRSLQYGATREALEQIARSSGLEDASATRIVDAFLEVCIPVVPADSARRSVLVRTVPAALELARLVAKEFARRGHRTAVTGSDNAEHLEDADLAVEIADFVIPPRRYLPLVSADLPHLAVVRDADGLQVGPLVVPGRTPCLRCQDLRRLTEQASWAAVATQLATARAARLREEIAWIGALQAGIAGERFLAAAVDRRSGLPGTTALSASAQFIDAATAEIRPLPQDFHDGCGCRAPLDSETARRAPADMRAAG